MSGPLTGVRVLELARVPPAELPGMMLGDLGADVIKVETPSAAPATPDERRRAVASPLNRNKRSMLLDLKTDRGRAVLHRLAPTVDVVIEGFRPGTTRRLGADYETMTRLNATLVYCSLSGYGQTGPYREWPGHDINFLALSGALALFGPPDTRPVLPLNLVADYAGAGLHAAFAIVVALMARGRSGAGEYIDVSYLDTTVALLGAVPGMSLFADEQPPLAPGQGFLAGTFPYYGVYATADDQWLAVGCVEPHFWERFCRLIGRPDLVAFGPRPGDDRAWPDPARSQARDSVAAIIRGKTREEWWDLLGGAQVCVTKVVRPAECEADPHLRARGMVAAAPHLTLGPQRQPASPVQFSTTTPSIRRAAPSPGEHTDEILAELGMA
jgi:crotonobetainyl-CoA:carnitine CoA-transferase CaiB-like acyl-CoA transferase